MICSALTQNFSNYRMHQSIESASAHRPQIERYLENLFEVVEWSRLPVGKFLIGDARGAIVGSSKRRRMLAERMEQPSRVHRDNDYEQFESEQQVNSFEDLNHFVLG